MPSPAQHLTTRLGRVLHIVAAIAALALPATFASAPTRADDAPATPPTATDWPAIVEQARGQTVYFNAWGGAETINAYIAWVGERVAADYGVTLRHVKLADTADAVARVLAEKTAGRVEGGSVDLIWINGENFAAMKANGLLYGPFTQALPSHALVDTETKPTTTIDFTIPVEGLEAPWGMAQLVFLYDTAREDAPPKTVVAFLDWAAANPGRFTYPAPPDFIGSTFLKQALHALTPDPGVLAEAPADDAAFAAATAPLWAFLDALHPHLWRGGEAFPQSGQAQRQLLDDGAVDISLSFNPGEASSAIAQGLLPETIRTYVLDGGTIGNTHFVAIPFNASAREGALVVADFLMSPEAQLRKQDAAIWGDPTVLAMAKLTPAARDAFAAQPRGVATLAPDALGPALPEPHAAWMTMIEAEWQKRYGS
jgi:putative thiamine transport system substrate-binding protein